MSVHHLPSSSSIALMNGNNKCECHSHCNSNTSTTNSDDDDDAIDNVSCTHHDCCGAAITTTNSIGTSSSSISNISSISSSTNFDEGIDENYQCNLKPHSYPWYPYMESMKPGIKKFPTRLHALLKEDNPYIISGYRKMPIESIQKCLLSIFTLHNETLNIWTHLIPSLYFGYLIIHCTMDAINLERDGMDVIISFIYYSSAFLIYLLSAIYHIFRMNNESSYHFCLICDLRGIISIFSGANIWSSYYILKGFNNISMILTCLSLMGYIHLWTWIPKMVKYRLSKQRTIYFAIYSTLGIISMILRFYMQYQYIFKPLVENISIFDLILNATFGTELNIPMNTNPHLFKLLEFNRLLFRTVIIRSYILLVMAMIFRVTKFPEKYFPYKFDIFGASHQIFHAIVAICLMWNHYDLWEDYTINNSYQLHDLLLEYVKTMNHHLE